MDLGQFGVHRPVELPHQRALIWRVEVLSALAGVA